MFSRNVKNFKYDDQFKTLKLVFLNGFDLKLVIENIDEYFEVKDLINLTMEDPTGFKIRSKILRKKKTSKIKNKRNEKNSNKTTFGLKDILSAHDLEVNQIIADGNCLFRAISHQLHGHENNHNLIRKNTCDFIQYNKDYFKDFIYYIHNDNENNNSNQDKNNDANANNNDKNLDERVDLYIDNLRKLGTYGDHYSILAFSIMYTCNVYVFENGKDVLKINKEDSNYTQNIYLLYDPIIPHYLSLTKK